MSSHHCAPVVQDPWSCFLLVLSLLLGQRISQTPGLAATMLFSAEDESGRLSFPGFLLGSLNTALVF